MLIYQNDIEILQDLNPKSKIIGKFEIGVPFNNLKVKAYYFKDEKLPPIEDAFLRLYKLYENEQEKLNLISKDLGLTIKEIENAYYRLIEMEFIDYLNKSLTDEGRKYINDSKYSNREATTINILVNNLTGEYDKNEYFSFINTRDINKMDINIPYDNKVIDVNEIISLDLVKRIWEHRKSDDPFKYDGEISELLNIRNESTVYKKYIVYYLFNEQNKLEIRVFDKNSQSLRLEKFITEEEATKNNLTQNKYDIYFEKEVGEDEKYIEKKYSEITNKVSFDDHFIFRNIDERIDIIIPLITFADIPTILELSIKKAMENGKKVTLYLCGGEYINKNQREILNSIIELLKKSKNGEVLSLREYFPQSIITDSNSGVLYLPSIVPLKNSGIISRVVQYTTNTMSLDVLSYFKKNVKINAIQKFDESWTKSELKKITEDIYSLLEEVDELLSDIRLGWSKEKNLSEIQRNLESFSITSKEEQFLKFIKNIYIDFVESFKKVSKKSKGKQYFDEKFHNDFPELSDALNRIRVYRNQNSHDWLDPKIKKMYFEFIIKDFEGYCPLALDNMYIIMQKRILIETLKALETTYEKLRSFKRPF